MRIAVAGFMHESNTFNPILADREAFVAQGLAFGKDLLTEWRDAHHEMAGFLDAAEEFNFEAVPVVMAWATPSGPVTEEVFEEITETIVEGVRRSGAEGMLLALHGAMVSTAHLDADGEILARIRAAMGRSFPLAVTFDLHGNLSPRVGELCDLAVAYRTNPHVDQRERGREAARLLVRWLRKEVSPRLALVKPALLMNIMKQDTSEPPLAEFMRELTRRMEEPGILTASLLPGFAYADVPHLGPSVVVVADGEQERARRQAEEVSAKLWEEKERFEARLPDAETAVRMALEAEKLPVVLVDTGDNVGGGSAGDGTILLAELLRQEATGFAVMLFAPAEVAECTRAGVGGTVRLRVGGKVDRLHGDPVEVTGIVQRLHAGTYQEDAVRHGGKRLHHMGPTAVVELAGENLLVLTSLRHPPFSLGALSCLGIQAEKRRILVVKAAIAYKAAYAPLGGTIVEVATPGWTNICAEAFPYRWRRPGIWPLEKV